MLFFSPFISKSCIRSSVSVSHKMNPFSSEKKKSRLWQVSVRVIHLNHFAILFPRFITDHVASGVFLIIHVPVAIKIKWRSK